MATVAIPARSGEHLPPPLARAGLVGRSAAGLVALVRDGAASAVEVVTDHLQQIAVAEPHLHALLDLDAAGALRAARLVDRHRAAGRPVGPLAGVPVVVKDNIAVRGRPLTCGSRARGKPAEVDATVVTRLRRAGAVVVGSANLDEFAMGASTETSAFGASRNPWDLTRTPGGSSGGSAAAVAGWEVPLAVGTDTGGSIREPAAACGLVGAAPSAGAVSVRGVVPFAPALDRVGPLARTVADAALLQAVLAGDAGLLRLATGMAAASIDPVDRAGLAGLTVGVVTELAGAANQPAVRAGLDLATTALTERGATVVLASVPAAGDALEVYYALASAACVEVLAPWVGAGLLGSEALRRHTAGTRLLAEPGTPTLRMRAAQRTRLREQVGAALEACDVLISPTMPVTAPRLGTHPDDPLSAPRTDCWTVLANLAGVPALSVPVGLSPGDHLPVGVQLLAPAGRDPLLYRVAEALAPSRDPLQLTTFSTLVVPSPGVCAS